MLLLQRFVFILYEDWSYGYCYGYGTGRGFVNKTCSKITTIIVENRI